MAIYRITVQNTAILDIRLCPQCGASPWWVNLSTRHGIHAAPCSSCCDISHDIRQYFIFSVAVVICSHSLYRLSFVDMIDTTKMLCQSVNFFDPPCILLTLSAYEEQGLCNGRPSVRLSPIDRLQPRQPASLLLSALRAGDLDRQLQGARHQCSATNANADSVMLIADGGGLTWTCLGLFLATHNASPVLHFCIVIHAAIFSIHVHRGQSDCQKARPKSRFRASPQCWRRRC